MLLWDTSRPEIPQILRDERPDSQINERVVSATYSPNGKWIATATEGGAITVWDMEPKEAPQPRRLAEGHEFLTTTGMFFADGSRLLTSACDNTTRVWDVGSGAELIRWGRSWREPDGTGFRGVAAVSQDGRWIATGGSDGPEENENNPTLANIWNADTGNSVCQIPISDSDEDERPDATALAFSPDVGGSLFVGDQFGAGHLYNTETGAPQEFSIAHNGKVTAARFLSDNDLLTASVDGTGRHLEHRLAKPAANLA